MTQALTRTGRRVRRPLTEDRKRVFLAELRRHGAVAEAARIASPASRDRHGAKSTFVDAKRRDPAFSAEWDAAQEEADAKLLMEARRRAVEGVPRGIFQKGGRVLDHDGKPATEHLYSDRLMELLLKARFPCDFVERRQIEHSSKASGWVITQSDLHCLDEEHTAWLHKIVTRVMEARGEIESDPAAEAVEYEDADYEEVPAADEETKDAIPW